jgi:AraC-like DNA-binding protein
MTATNADPQHFPFDNVISAVAGSVVYPPGGRFGPRLQKDIQLVLLYTGNMDVTIEGKLLQVQPGHIILLTPGREETFVFARKEETWHRWISVHLTELSEDAIHYLNSLPIILPLTEEMNRLTDLMLSLQIQSQQDDLLMRTLGLAALHLYPSESIQYRQQREKHPSVYMAISWIRDHYAREFTLIELAKQSGISPEHLVRLFRKDMRRTPIQYVWEYRVERAMELLIHTGISVFEVAQRCGFKTSHHFSRMIKQATGRTPTQIRQSSR